MKKQFYITFLFSSIFMKVFMGQEILLTNGTTAVYRVQSYADHSVPQPPPPNAPIMPYATFRDAIYWVNNFNWVIGANQINTAIIDINFKQSNYQTNPQQTDALTNAAPPPGAPYANHIVLNSDLDLISVPAGKTLIIRADKNYFGGFYANPMINGNLTLGSLGPLTRCLEVSSTSAGTIKFENLKFIDWNLAMNFAYIGGSWSSGYTPTKISHASFSKCIRVSGASALEVRDCEFLGYSLAIEFDNNIANTNIHHNYFETAWRKPKRCYSFNPSSGVPDFGGVGSSNPIDVLMDDGVVWWGVFSQAISLESIVNSTLSSGPMNNTNIHDNHFNDAAYVSEVENGGAIYLRPLGIFTDFSLPYSARANIDISNNVIKNLSVGIFQEWGPCVRNGAGPDLSYQLNIQGNILQNRMLCLNLGLPYNHFNVSGNTFNMDNNFSKFFDYPKAIHFGGTALIQSGGLWFGGPNPTCINLYGDNYLGFEMIYDPSNPANSRNLNTFNFTPGSTGVYPSISTEGNFGPRSIPFNSLPIPQKTGILFKNIKFPGPIIAGSGIGVSVKNCTLNSWCDEYSKFPPFFLEPCYYYTASGLDVPANEDIPPPFISNAYLVNNTGGPTIISVSFDLPGPFYSDSRKGPFLVQFYKSNDKSNTSNPGLDNPYGDFTHMLQENIIPTPLLGSSYNINVTMPNAAVTFGHGDIIAMTVTSLGTDPSATDNQTCGTSAPSYYKVAECPKCLPAFSPKPGKKYIASCWTRLKDAENATTYDNLAGYLTPVIKIVYYSAYFPPTAMGNPILLRPSGPIIDGWQKIEGEVEIPANAKGILVEVTHDTSPVNAGLGASFFDDIRFYPADGSMKSYVFDSDTKRLMSELDENNYATFYEYDEEGKLVRVKKETEKGIMTIKESRNNKPIR